MIRPSTPSNPSPLSTPPRSTTFPTKPAHKHHISHPHPHRVHHHHHHHPDKTVPQSAIVPPTSSPFGDFLTKTSISRHDGRADGYGTPPRGQEQQSQQSHDKAHEVKDTEREREGERERETWKEVEKLRARRKAADDDLRSRLSRLSTLSTTTTRRLDYTYYSLLSSISSLTSSLSSLSSLSTQTSTLQTHFSSSSSSITSEITSQISASNSSADQARRISQLENRIKEGRERVGKLGERLDDVRNKVERSSLRDRESRRTIGRRLKMLWGTLGFLIGLFLILAATRQWRRNGNATKGEAVHSGSPMEDGSEKVLGTHHEIWERNTEMAQPDKEGKRASAKADMNVQATAVGSSAVDVDATLRLFDEL